MKNYCSLCGTQLTEGDRFCRNCGTKISDTIINTTESVDTPKKLHSRNIISAILITVLSLSLIIGIIAGINSAKHTIDLSDYFTVSTVGYDGYGTVTGSVDSNALAQKIFNNTDISHLNNDDAMYSEFCRIIESIVIKNDVDTTHMKNGDTVTFTVNYCGDRYNKNLKYMIKDGKYTYEVTNLEPLTKIDLPDDKYCILNKTGINGSGKINLHFKSDYFVNKPEITYSENNTHLSNGDKYSITYKFSDNDYAKASEILAMNGLYFDKTGTIDGIASGFKELTDSPFLTEDDIKAIKKEISSFYKNNNFKATNAELIGVLFCESKDEPYINPTYAESELPFPSCLLVAVSQYSYIAENGKPATSTATFLYYSSPDRFIDKDRLSDYLYSVYSLEGKLSLEEVISQLNSNTPMYDITPLTQ